MKIGLLSDIHGDIHSLQKALTIFQRFNVESILCSGDVVEKGNHDDEVVTVLRELQIDCAQGNHDENAIRHYELNLAVKDPDAVDLKPETIDYLRTLPTVIEKSINNTFVLVTHAIPSLNSGRVFHDDGPHRLSKPFKKDLARTDCQIMVVGHTHTPFDLQYREKRIINPGSTCSLKGRDSHTVGILELPSGRFSVIELQDGTPFPIHRRDVA